MTFDCVKYIWDSPPLLSTIITYYPIFEIKISCSIIVRGFSLYFKYLGLLFEDLSGIAAMTCEYI